MIMSAETAETADIYEGEYKDGVYHGQGTMIYSNRDKYVGEWKDGNEHGQGTYTYSDGDTYVYVGEFKDGKFYGQGTITYPVDISDFKSPEIQITDDIGMKMKFPQVETLQKYSSWVEGENTEKKFKLIIECIDYIWDGDSIYKAKDSTKKELTDFLEALNSRQFQKVRNFVESMPRLSHGNKYVGGWKDDKKHGQGTYTFTSGVYEVGEYKDGDMYNGKRFDIEEEGGNTIFIYQEGKKWKQKELFLSENKLTILPNGNIRDENFEEYELEEERGDFIVYKPEGMRGKRAYIKTDGKNYLAWAGPIKIADKSKFLRGDFEKAKEESQPIEEATVQEQEVKNLEVKQEKSFLLIGTNYYGIY